MRKNRRYYWNMYQISDKIKLLEELLHKEKNLQKKELILDDILLLKDFICEMEEAKLPSKTPKLLDSYEYIKDYLNQSTFCWNEFIDFYEILDDAFSNNYVKILQIPKMTLSKEDILSLTHDFYKSLNPFIFKNFMKHFYRRFNHVNFSTSQIDNYSGFSVCLSNRDESYIDVVKDNTIEVVLTMIHEYEHSISSSINYNHMNNRLFMEFDTLFMELIAQDYLKNVTHNKGISIIRYNNLLTQYFNSNDIYDLIHLISAEKEQTPFTSNKILKNIALNKCNIEPLDVDILLYENSGDLTNDNYLLGYILAVELYKIYQVDKEKALYLLKEIILLNNNNSNEQYYSNIKRLGVVPNLSTYQFQKETVLELKRTLKKNSNNSK